MVSVLNRMALGEQHCQEVGTGATVLTVLAANTGVYLCFDVVLLWLYALKKCHYEFVSLLGGQLKTLFLDFPASQ